MDHKVIYILFLVILIVNVITFAMYGIDKMKAIKHRWRIPESALIGMAFAFGGAGAFLGMQLFRHKTKHIKFIILVPLALFLEIILAVMLLKKFW